MTAAARKKAVREAGETIMQLILDSPGVLDAIAHDVIEAKVTDGELIWTQSLLVGPGLEIQPKGSLRTLEDAIDAALDAIEAGNLNRAKNILEATIPAPEDEPPVPAAAQEPEEAGGDEDDAEEVAEGAPEVEEDGEPEAEAATEAPRRRRRTAPEPEAEEPTGRRRLGRPADFPELDQEYTCINEDEDGDPCGAVMSGNQAQISYTRFRVKLCEECLATYDPLKVKNALVKAP